MNTQGGMSDAAIAFAISKGDGNEQNQNMTFKVTLVSGSALASNIAISSDGTLLLNPTQYVWRQPI